MPKKSDKEPIDIAKEIIERSGNTFHSKVLKYLQEKGWTVLISPYYNDNLSNKPREIDLIAEKAFPIKKEIHGRSETVHVKLFIECKYISQTTVFWFHDKDKQKAEDLVSHTTPEIKNHLHMKKHHYLGGINKVAKLFADQRKKAADNEFFYKALNQSLNAMIYYRNKGSIIELPNGHFYNIFKIINYPVIVCSSFDRLFRVELGDDFAPINIDDNFLLELNYAYRNSDGNSVNEYFLIDVLSFNMFDSYLEKIEHDVKIVDFFKA